MSRGSKKFVSAIRSRRSDPTGFVPALLPRLGGDLSAVDSLLVQTLLTAISHADVGVCLCDAEDMVRFANDVFVDAFMPEVPRGRSVDFMDGVAASIRAGRGIKLESTTLDRFVARVRQRRLSAAAQCDFAVDLADGRWFWVNDQKLANGWMLSVASDITRIKGEELQLKRDHAWALEAARTDYLTGLPNRRHGIEQAEQAVMHARGTGAPLSIAILDIDNFKAINDRYGHDVGDRVLVHFAQLSGERLRPRDQISRMGGEEFLLTLPDSTPRQAASLVDRLIDKRVSTAHHPPVAYTVSAGIAAAPGGGSLQDLLDRADVALYRAKANGRARVELSVS